MKKLFALLIVSLPFLASAQESKEAGHKEKTIREFTLGVMVDFVGTHNFGDPLPFAMSTSAAPSLNILTKHTHNHIMYGLNDNSIQTLNGYLLKKNWDIYNFLSKSIVTRDAYGSIGIEKVLLTPGVDFVFFAEVGTNFYGSNSTSIGLVIHPQLSLRRVEGKG